MNISEIYQQGQNVIATLTGTILQILFTKNLTFRLTLTILVSSILVGLYIIHPMSEIISEHLKLSEKAAQDLKNIMLSISGLTSIAIIKLILSLVYDNKWISIVTKAKIAQFIGVDEKLLLEEERRNENSNK